MIEKKDDTCCSNPPKAQLDEQSRQSLVKFVITFIIGILLIGAILYYFKDAPGIRHLFMSPEQMKEHTVE